MPSSKDCMRSREEVNDVDNNEKKYERSRTKTSNNNEVNELNDLKWHMDSSNNSRKCNNVKGMDTNDFKASNCCSDVECGSCSQSVKVSKSKKKEQPSLKLPASLTKYAATANKTSSSPKSRRVLIYNSQNLSLLSYKRSFQPKFKSQCESKYNNSIQQFNDIQRESSKPTQSVPGKINRKYANICSSSEDSCGEYDLDNDMPKKSPNLKSRRVFIYNKQNSNISHLSSYKRAFRLKLKSQFEPKQDKSTQQLTDNQNVTSNSNLSGKYDNEPDSKDIASDDDDSYESDLDNISEIGGISDLDVSSDAEECYRAHAYNLTHPDGDSNNANFISSLSYVDDISNPKTLLVPSLFPNVPPYLAFSSYEQKGPDVPADLYRILKWKVTNVMPRLMRTILVNSGMRLIKKTDEWMATWGKHMKAPCFRTLKPYQKINHLPGSFKIGRKDACWKNLLKQMSKHGKKEYGFMPKTYIIPSDLKQLRRNWPKYAKKEAKWIIKPPASARGTGIKVVDKWSQIPKRKPLVVQKYIERPLLINGSKFDLRLYVLVTSINPLRVYMYRNGLARFASAKYSNNSDTLGDRCMHLTNYSINKLSTNYAKNEDVNACQGHKWTIKSLWNYLANRGIRTDLLWEALKSLVLRTILAGESQINAMMRNHVGTKYNCFELLGFDVLLDADLIPWLLEVNISPSLHSELPLDEHVKSPLAQSVLNTALYNVPPKLSPERQQELAAEMFLPPGPICYEKRMYVTFLSRAERIKHITFLRKSMENRNQYIDSILDKLTPDDVRCLILSEDELARSSPLERIFPTSDTYKYLKFTENPRYYNRLLDAWETRYSNNRNEGINLLRQYCETQYHLQVPQMPNKKISVSSGLLCTSNIKRK